MLLNPPEPDVFLAARYKPRIVNRTKFKLEDVEL